MLWNIFHKGLPLLALPFGAALCLLAASLWRPRRVWTAAALAILAVFSMPRVGDALMRSVESRYPAMSIAQTPRADVVFELGGGAANAGSPGFPLEPGDTGSRFERAIALYLASRAPVLLLSAGGEPPAGVLNEGDALRRVALARGVPEQAVLVTPIAPDTTAEEAAFCEMASQRHWRRLLLVTSASHMWRAVHLFAKCRVDTIPVPVAYEVPPVPLPPVFTDFLPEPACLDRSDRALHEYLGRFFYSLTSL